MLFEAHFSVFVLTNGTFTSCPARFIAAAAAAARTSIAAVIGVGAEGGSLGVLAGDVAGMGLAEVGFEEEGVGSRRFMAALALALAAGG
jgi:hypothetical protein